MEFIVFDWNTSSDHEISQDELQLMKYIYRRRLIW